MRFPRLPGGLRWWHCYLALLLSSLIWQATRPGPQPESTQLVLELPLQNADGAVEGPSVRLAYRDRGMGFPVVYLHGSPGSGADSNRLAEAFPRGRRFLAPDLPGFGASSRDLPDYGIEAHARYVLAFLDAHDIERAHLIGHSMGTGVALHVAHLAPERVASIVSYAGIGIQEGEGSGDYYLEHTKYAVGYGLLVTLPDLLPHFGWLGPRSSRKAFIRNFWDTDQRPLRRILESLETPLLILHGRDDPLVPAATAEAHHRIVEHSELVMFDASHFMVFTRRGSEKLASNILPFFTRHDAPGVAPARRTLDRSRGPRSRSQLPTNLDLQDAVGPWAQIGILFAATFVSEDLTCISAGLLARDQRIDLFVAVLGCLLGIFVSDLWLWGMGRWIGRPLLRWRWIARRVTPESLRRFGFKLDRHLGKTVFASRFLPGTRLPMYVAAGIVSKRPFAFAGWLFLAALFWTPLLVLLATIFGPVAAKPFQVVLGVGWMAWVGAALLMLLALRIVALLLTREGRLRLIAGVSKVWRWEFWPVWLFYLPVLPWIGWLALRHGGLTIPTATNPGQPHGGFVGESKYDILRALPSEWVQPSLRIERSESFERAEHLLYRMETDGWEFPLILKPDEGQRGLGLKLVQGPDEAREYLATESCAVLAQTYHPGPCEVGIFYYRIPDEPTGRIFSITDKVFPRVVGDGRSTLEELILDDDRLRMQLALFSRRHAARLSEVPAAGERVGLAIAGNHCQGTMFLDGAELITPALERMIDEIARQYDGFYFGRFDIRAASRQALAEGRGFRILELNGVTSESTNIYDPSTNLLSAYATLFRQWSIAFRIGAMNRKRGHATSSIASLIRAACRHYRHRSSRTLAD